MQINSHATVEILSWYFVTDKEWLECKGSDRLFQRINQSNRQTKWLLFCFFIIISVSSKIQTNFSCRA